MKDKANFRNVKTPGSHISDYQDGLILFPEIVEGIGSHLHVHLAINAETGMQLPHQRHQVVNVESGRHKNYHFLLLYHIVQQIQENRRLFLRSNYEEIDLHCLR